MQRIKGSMDYVSINCSCDIEALDQCVIHMRSKRRSARELDKEHDPLKAVLTDDRPAGGAASE
jgi:hypothetical protein